MKTPHFLSLSLAAACGCLFFGFSQAADEKKTETPSKETTKVEKVTKTDAEWKQLLTPEQYRITRQAGTERPYGAKYKEIEAQGKGTYYCVACGNKLFESSTKFHSGCGWPSFYDKASASGIIEKTDNTLGMKRVEVNCAKCDSHLGHVFDDGPKPTGLRYCINGEAIKFVAASEEKSVKPEVK